MNKSLLSLTAAAVFFCTPVFADDTSTTPSSTTTTTSTDTTTPGTSTSDMANGSSMQLKTSDGKTFNVLVNSADMANLKVGDTLTVGSLTGTSATTPATTSTTSTDTSSDTSNKSDDNSSSDDDSQ